MRVIQGVAVSIWLLVASLYSASDAYAQQLVFGKQAFLSQLGASATVIDFEDLPAESILDPDAYQASGVRIEQVDGFPLYVGQWQYPYETALIVPSGTKAISSSWAGTSHGGVFLPVCNTTICQLYWNDAASDHVRISFASPKRAAGIHLGQNDVDGVTVTWFDTAGAVILSRHFPGFQPWNEFVGLVSDVPIGSIVVNDLANDGDGIYYDDLIFQSVAIDANAGADFSVNEGTNGVTLNGIGTGLPSSGTLSYSWVQLPGGPSVVLSSPNTAHPSFTAPYVAFGGETLTFQLTVTAYGVTSTDAVSVTIVNINHTPVAEAGEDQSVAEGSPVILHGEASFDPDGDESLSGFTYSWLQVSGSPFVTLTGAATTTPTFTAPYVGSGGAPGVVATLVFELRVNDGFPADSPAPGFTFDNVADRVTVRITNVNNAPAAEAGADQTVDETASVSLSAAASSDPDSDSLTYAWSQTAGPAVSLSGAMTGAPTFTAPYVAAGGADLSFQLTVNDGYGGLSSDTVVVRVQNVNDPPLATAARPTVGVLWPPNHALVRIGIVGVTDPNNDAVITITGITQDEPTTGLGDGDTAVDAVINSDGSVLLRAERAGGGDGRVYRVRFTASDSEGSSSGEVFVSVPQSAKKPAVNSGQNFDSTQ
jgi:hypothetical protein